MSITERFLANREALISHNQFLSHLLVAFDENYHLELPRAPGLSEACEAAFGSYTCTHTHTRTCTCSALTSVCTGLRDSMSVSSSGLSDDCTCTCSDCSECSDCSDDNKLLIPFREVIGAVGSYEWRRRGVLVPALGDGVRIYPHFSVFAPSARQEYIKLLAEVPLPKPPGGLRLGYDVGVGTGVLTALMIKRGVQNVVATDVNPRALECARDNLTRLGLLQRVKLVEGDIFPCGEYPTDSEGADLIVCNPPWLPLPPQSLLDKGVYDHKSDTLKSFLLNVRHHLKPSTGECFLIISDLAELLGLRSRGELLDMIDEGGLEVLGKTDTPAEHRRGSVL